MENKQAQLFILVGVVVVLLLMMHALPSLKVGEIALRDVDILSDVLPELDADENDRSPFALPNDSVDQQLLGPEKHGQAKLKDGRSERGDEKASSSDGDDVTVEYPGDVQGGHHVSEKNGNTSGAVQNCIVDYSGGDGHGLSGFYGALDRLSSLGRPVRVAYWGDSYIEADILTCDLREKFQDRFGGQGPGWVDCGKTTNSTRPTVKQRTNGFKSHSVVEKGYRASLLGISLRRCLWYQQQALASVFPQGLTLPVEGACSPGCIPQASQVHSRDRYLRGLL